MFNRRESVRRKRYRFEEWREALESNGLRISRSKTGNIKFDFNHSEGVQRESTDTHLGKISGDEVGEVDKFIVQIHCRHSCS